MVADYDIEKAFRAIEDELMKSMIRNMKRHRLEEVKEKKEWEMWQALQLKSLEEYKRSNKKQFQGKFSQIDKEIASIISASRTQGNMVQEIKILEAMRKGFKPSKGLQRSTQTMGEFFKLNDRKLEALIKATQNDFKKAERAMLRMAEDQYRKTIFSAQVYANTGAGTYEQAVDMATKDFLSRGINCIEYANGARHTIANYTAMAIQTASKRAYLAGEGEKRAEWGIHTVIINKRGNACPKCLPFVGKVLIDDVWSGGKQSDGPYLLMSYAMAQGLYHPRCKDIHTTYFEGISTPGVTYTKEELKKIENSYRLDGKRQYAKRQADKYTRLADNTLDEDSRKKYEGKAQLWKDKARELKDIISGETARKVSEFKKGVKKVSNADVQTLLHQSSNRVKFKPSGNKRSYFDSDRDIVYLARSSASDTVAHELFHEIDTTYKITESGMLTESINGDFKRLQYVSRGYGMDIKDMLYLKHKEAFTEGKKGIKLRPEYRGISDILNGMSGGEINLGYVHSKEYWKKKGTLEAETWAQFGRILYNQDKEVLDMLKFICPDTCNEIMRTLEGMIK